MLRLLGYIQGTGISCGGSQNDLKANKKVPGNWAYMYNKALFPTVSFKMCEH